MQLLIVDDDDDFREAVARYFARKGHVIHTAACGDDALRLAEKQQFEVGVFDLRMPGMSGLELLTTFRAGNPETEVMMLTGEGTIELAVEAMRHGAYDFLTKPCPLAELERRCQKATEAGRLRRENRRLRALMELGRPRHQLIGESSAMQAVFRMIERAGPSPMTVLIQGESGAGKELVARALQKVSPRADQAFVVVNCAAMPESLLESEFFGYERGAFTGAGSSKPGLFEMADQGTLFIDEIGELAMPLQAKLLRVLEDGTFRRVGSVKEHRADVRVIAATNRNLEEACRRQQFREDLYFRLNVLTIDLPPLRDRPEDVPLLTREFLGPGWELTPEAEEALRQCRWPGNVRQLKHAIERAKILAEGRRIELENLPNEVRGLATSALADRSTTSSYPPVAMADAPPTSTVSAPIELEEVERTHVLSVLAKHGNNKARAARALGIHRRKLYRLLERWEEKAVKSDAAPGGESHSVSENASSQA